MYLKLQYMKIVQVTSHNKYFILNSIYLYKTWWYESVCVSVHPLLVSIIFWLIFVFKGKLLIHMPFLSRTYYKSFDTPSLGS